jgi:hypothetical protein
VPVTSYKVVDVDDLHINYDMRRHIGQVVEHVKVCRSGLYQVRAEDGTLLMLAKRYLEPIQ